MFPHTSSSGQRVKQLKLGEAERRELNAILLRNPSLRQARDLLHARLFQNGITLATPDSENTVVTPAFAEILEKHYLPFARGVLDDYIAFGYSHFYLRTITISSGGKRRKVTIPEQLPFGAYDVYLETEPFQPVRLNFQCTLNANQVEDIFSLLGGSGSKKERGGGRGSKRSKASKKGGSVSVEKPIEPRRPTIYPIIFDPSILPDLHTRRHNSLIASLIRSFKYTDVLTRFNLQAEYLRANPKLITKPRETNSKAKNSIDIDPDSIVDSELLRVREKRRNNMKLQSMKAMVECQEHARGFQRMVAIDDELIQLHDQTENIFHLPYDVELASSSVQQAASRQDLLDFQLNNSRETLQVLGIPSSLVAGRDVSLKNAGAGKMNENDLKLFFKSLMGYKRIVQAGLQIPYDMIYHGSGQAQREASGEKVRASSVKPVEIVRTEEESVADSGQEVSRAGVQGHSTELVEIPLVNDTLSADTILMLAENGAIDEEEKKKYLLIYAGLANLVS